MAYLASFWKFSRPHTIFGTSLSIFALYFIAIATTQATINLENLGVFFGVWFACLCGNVYIVGLNQLYDVEIDQINKPDLPLASGQFSLKQGQWIVGLTGVFAISMAAWVGFWVWLTVAISLLIGTAYSVPPIRLKRFPLLAALCILTVRGVIVNLGLYLQFTDTFTQQRFIPAVIWILTLFILIFTIAIAVFKDVPDLEGDKKYQIQTFTLIWGSQAIFNLTRWIITLCYLGMILAGIFILKSVNTPFFVGFHLVLFILLGWRSREVDLNSKAAIASFYQFIWKLFFLEYILFPLACSLRG
ncbi:MAG: homogentisate phytyltransferase [Snowella sp.]|nr:homogentisate phytyltransferase [Snowella sp.]